MILVEFLRCTNLIISLSGRLSNLSDTLTCYLWGCCTLTCSLLHTYLLFMRMLHTYLLFIVAYLLVVHEDATHLLVVHCCTLTCSLLHTYCSCRSCILTCSWGYCTYLMFLRMLHTYLLFTRMLHTYLLFMRMLEHLMSRCRKFFLWQ